MRHGICWEQQNGKGRRAPRFRGQGGWYSCLLLFFGAMACVFSAYCQLCGMFPAFRLPSLPEWGYLALTAAVPAAVYGSGRLKYWWLRLLPVLPVGYGFYRYYVTHRLAVEDGSIYIARSYVVAFCQYYKISAMFPTGFEEQAPGALLFWSLLLLTALFILSAVVCRYYLLLVLPLAVLAAGLIVGRAPGWTGMSALLAGALVLGARWRALPGRWYVRSAQLAVILCICIITGQVFASAAGRVAGLHDTVQETQTALEDRVLRLPVWDLLEQDGTVTNRSPRRTGREVLSIWLSGEATENIYLKDFSASRYENGRWRTEETDFDSEAEANHLTGQEAGEALLAMAYEANEDVFDPEAMSGFAHAYASPGSITADGGWQVAAPQLHDYIIDCKGFGTSAPIPYVSKLPEKLRAEEDVAVKKPWNLKSYRGSLMLGGRRGESVLEYLQMYYLHRLTGFYSLGYYGAQEAQPRLLDWYGKLAGEAYTRDAGSEAVDNFTEEKMNELGFYWQKEEMDAAWDTVNTIDLNYVRIVYAAVVQYILQRFGSYSQKLDALPEGADPVDYFLTTSGEGYCVHYASAAVLMLQNMGVPARYASGYVVFPDDFQKAEGADGYTATVTDKRAHAWAEIYLEDFGWMPLEATPGFEGEPGAADGGTADDGESVPSPGSEEDDADDGADEEPEEPGEDENEPEDQKEEDDKANGDKDADVLAGDDGILDRELSGVALRQWLCWFAGLLAAAFAVWLAVFLVRRCRRRQDELLRREIRSGQYRAAIVRMNRRIYRRLCGRHFLKGVRIRDDESYRRALKQQYGEQGIDVDAYMRLVRQAYFSGGEMSAEDARAVYGVYTCAGARK